MTPEDRDAILGLIEKMRLSTSADDLDRTSADLATLVMLAADPEMEWAAQNPVILQQGGRVYRAVQIS
jgi:hypothetical protein